VCVETANSSAFFCEAIVSASCDLSLLESQRSRKGTVIGIVVILVIFLILGSACAALYFNCGAIGNGSADPPSSEPEKSQSLSVEDDAPTPLLSQSFTHSALTSKSTPANVLSSSRRISNSETGKSTRVVPIHQDRGESNAEEVQNGSPYRFVSRPKLSQYRVVDTDTD
jgi:hypothetical protein